MTELVLNQVNKTFLDQGQQPHLVLKDINLEAKEDEFIVIVGPSGCGKSTLLRLISGLIPASEGVMTLNGQTIEGTSSNRGMVFQRSSLFPWLTVRDNINFSLRLHQQSNDSEVERLIQMIGLEDYADFYPRQLSGGMAQRVSLARTMINQPEVFLLDEPLGALDEFTRMKMQRELLDLWQTQRNLMIMVTHDIDEAIYMATKIVVMKAHPGEIEEIIPIDLDYPRDRTSEDFYRYRTHIMQKLEINR